MSPKKKLPVIAHPPEAVLEIQDVADWLHVSTRTVERYDIPYFFIGRRQKRYLGEDVLRFIRTRREAA